MNEQIRNDLRQYYDYDASRRDADAYADWKREERQRFLELLQQEGKTRLLEIGAGPGRDSLFFQQQGLEVVCTDLSPEMVRLCRQKGLTAYVMDFYQLDFPPQSFDAIFALNCLLHVPGADLPAVLQRLHQFLQPAGLFYYGVYGGEEIEGYFSQSPGQQPRFFSYHTDEFMRQVVQQCFETVSFKVIPLEWEHKTHFQSMILRRKAFGREP
jgi:SAM-dependent methyltransferase